MTPQAPAPTSCKDEALKDKLPIYLSGNKGASTLTPTPSIKENLQKHVNFLILREEEPRVRSLPDTPLLAGRTRKGTWRVNHIRTCYCCQGNQSSQLSQGEFPGTHLPPNSFCFKPFFENKKHKKYIFLFLAPHCFFSLILCQTSGPPCDSNAKVARALKQ